MLQPKRTKHRKVFKGKMKGNDQLNDEDVWSILEYIKSVWPDSIQKKYKTMTKH